MKATRHKNVNNTYMLLWDGVTVHTVSIINQ